MTRQWAPTVARMAVFVVGATASSVAIASDFAALGYFLLGVYAVGFVVLYAIAWAIGTRIRHAGGRLLLHAVVLGFFLSPSIGDNFPFPAGLTLVFDSDPAKAWTCIAIGTLAIWIVAWWWQAKIKPQFDELAEHARTPEDRE